MVESRENLLHRPDVMLYGWTHDPYNVQGSLNAAYAFADFTSQVDLALAPIFFDEATDMPQSMNMQSAVNSIIAAYGLSGYELVSAFINTHHRIPSPHQIKDLIALCKSMDPTDLIGYSVDPLREVDINPSRYLLYRYIQALVNRPFIYKFEAHRQTGHKDFGGNILLMSTDDDKVYKALEQGSAEKVVTNYRSILSRLSHAHTRHREVRIVNQLTRLMNRFDGRTSGVFLLYGNGHLGMDERLKRKFRGKANIRGHAANSPVHGRHNEVYRHPDQCHDHTIGADFICYTLMEDAIDYFRGEGLLAEFALKYEDVESYIRNYLFNLSDEKIKAMLQGSLKSIRNSMMYEIYPLLY